MKAALEVALARLSVQRIAAAIWTHHEVRDETAPEAVELAANNPARKAGKIIVPPRGPRGVKQILIVNGQPIEAPAAVTDFLRELGHDGTARARPETARKLAELIPWAKVTRNPSAKVIDHKRLYAAGGRAERIAAITCRISCKPSPKGEKPKRSKCLQNKW